MFTAPSPCRGSVKLIAWLKAAGGVPVEAGQFSLGLDPSWLCPHGSCMILGWWLPVSERGRWTLCANLCGCGTLGRLPGGGKMWCLCWCWEVEEGEGVNGS